MPRTVTIGPAVYQRVNELVGEGKTRTEAFALVGLERDQPPGTVSANYYRVARSLGKTSGKARRSGSGARRGTATAGRQPRQATRATRPQTAGAGADGDLSSLAMRIGELTDQLVRRIEERDAEIRRILS
jgi:hypothetical protein